MLLSRLAIRLFGVSVLLVALLTITAVSAARVVLPYSGELAYVAYHGANTEIYLLDVARSRAYNLTRNEAYDGQPVWSPDGRHIAFVSDRDGRMNIYIMASTGGGLRRLSDGGARYRAPSWSSDGEYIIFHANFGAENDITYVARVDGSEIREITPGSNSYISMVDVGADSGSAANRRSPDGTYAIRLRYEEGWHFLVTDTATRTMANMVKIGVEFTELPVWSPDGRKIAFVSRARGAANVYVYDLDAAQTRRVFGQPFITDSLAWRPG